MSVPRRRVLRLVAQRRPSILSMPQLKARSQLAKEQAVLARWMTRFDGRFTRLSTRQAKSPGKNG